MTTQEKPVPKLIYLPLLLLHTTKQQTKRSLFFSTHGICGITLLSLLMSPTCLTTTKIFPEAKLV